MKALITDAWNIFVHRHGTLVSGAVAYFALLSITPMFIILIALVGSLTTEYQARTQLLRSLAIYVGKGGAATLGALLENMQAAGSGTAMTVLGVTVLLFGATRLFVQLRNALNVLWGVQARPRADFKGRTWQQVRRQAIAFLLVLLCGGLLLTSVLVRIGLSTAAQVVATAPKLHWHAIDHVGSFVAVTALFGVLFKVLPDVRIDWRDCAAGGFVTAVLFSVGKMVVAMYLARSRFSSTFGTAGSVVMLMFWAYYCAQVFFFGAALTAAWAKRHGRGLEPTEEAVALPPIIGQDAG